MTIAYGASWLIVLKASFDAGAEVRSGTLGWRSLLARLRPVFPDMPTSGLFRLIRQPINVEFVLTLWIAPVLTPDQLVVAVSVTTYGLLAPRLTQRRFTARFRARFDRYRAAMPYALPSLRPTKDQPDAQ